MTALAALLESSAKRHRAGVAVQLGLSGGADAADLAAALLDQVRLTRIVEGLGESARGHCLRAVLEPGAARLAGGPRADREALTELERHGLAFAFGDSWWREYRIPDDLRAPLRRALAARHTGAVAGARPKRWVGAPLQTLHDAAALSALMAREPVRVKADGQLYSRAWPALDRALAPLPLADDAFNDMRIDLALSFLREGGFLRLSVDDLPSSTIRRELVPAGDLGAALSEPPGALRERLLAGLDYGAHAATAALAETLAGQAVSLESFAGAIQAMLAEAGRTPYCHLDDISVALSALGPLWLAGAIELGLSGRGGLVAARFQPADPEPAGDRPLAVCQANFEVVLLRPPSPADRFVLELCCERAAGQEHVLRLTRESVRCGERVLRVRGGVRPALEQLVGELPQNVERSLADWAGGVKGPLRLRTAMMVEAADERAADELEAGALAGLCVERLGPRLLAVPGDALAELGRALSAAGEELEPGLDRISGSWREPPSRSDGAERFWLPSAATRHVPPPPGNQVSTLADARARPAAPPPAAEDPLDVVLRALEEGADVHIRYAGARGLTERQVTPFEVDDARLHAWCHLRRDERAFWLSSIQAASPVD